MGKSCWLILLHLRYSFGRVSPTCTMASSTPLTLSLLPLNSDIMFDIVLEIYFIPTKKFILVFDGLLR